MNRGNVTWSGIEAGTSALLSFVASFAIARLVGPAELGVGAAAVSVHVLLWVGVNALFADALVQRGDVDETLVASAFWSAAAVGTAAMLVQAGAGWGLARAIGDNRLLGMGLLLALPLPLVGMGGVMQGMLTRRRAYRLLAMRTLCGQGLGTLTGIGLALAGYGGWALVGQQAVVSLVGAGALLVGAGFRPAPVWHGPAVRGLLRLGLPLTASTLIMIARYRLFAVLIGSVAGPAALGEVHVAFRLVDTLRELTFTALWRLMLPILSDRQHDLPALRHEMDRLLRLSSLAVLPLCAAMAALLPSTVAVLLGPKWGPAGWAAEPLIGLMAVLTLMFPAGVALVAVGQPRVALVANIAGLAASAGGVVLLRPATPWHAVLVWCASQLFVTPYALWMTAKVLDAGLLQPVRAGLPALAASLAALLAVLVVVPSGGAAPGVLLWRGALLGACALVVGAAWLFRRSAAASPAPVELPPVDHPGGGS